jgi:hypothetical protein
MSGTIFSPVASEALARIERATTPPVPKDGRILAHVAMGRMMKLCKDCRFAVNRFPDSHAATISMRAYDWECQHPSSALPASPPNLVTGEIRPARQLPCPEARSEEASVRSKKANYCGPDGRFWEAKDEGPPRLGQVIGFGEALDEPEAP